MPLVARSVEEIIDSNLDEFIEWINFRPIKAGIPEWVRKAFPTRELDEITLLIEMLNEIIEWGVRPSCVSGFLAF